MIKNDRQLGAPFGLFSDTKTNIEALTGLTGGETAYATDTGEDGVYDAVAEEWVWGRSGGGGGDVAAETHAADEKTTPVDDDEFPLVDSEASWVLKKLTWENLKAAAKTYFDTIFAAIVHTHEYQDLTNVGVLDVLETSDWQPDTVYDAGDSALISFEGMILSIIANVGHTSDPEDFLNDIEKWNLVSWTINSTDEIEYDPADDDDWNDVPEEVSGGLDELAARTRGLELQGWVACSETWTRTGNHTFTVSGDVTAKYRKGTKIRYRDGGSDEYGVIGSSTHSSGTTTVNLIVNTDYAMAAATITDTYISYIDNPIGFPTKFEYSPTISGDSSMTWSTTSAPYAQWTPIGVGYQVSVGRVGTVGGTPAQLFRVTLPFVPAAVIDVPGAAQARDAGSGVVAAGTGGLSSAGSNLYIGKSDLSNWSTGTGRIIRISIFVPL
jgi:hypothetical protein